ncbi:sensor histidine kinase [Bacillus pseudomycoides]|uniref:sensor histidine kinase n=1 Tax=Bacillus pseudomycoides TaxID=64104 RepID=UPI000BEE7964|nr:sensor histidine kinase [Bacillus pseudomycoides]PEB38721.1 ATP-binding protein [Bacillus pseudomycoides]PGD95383.1 ATP-binding protein [Bacillus pseudomycoides]PGE01438.1 ATP-binding protein [Bacillus pseudomycoides]PHE63000.1 ATP-binding protein [Bacillus pseudomycoides]PHG25597.1 ATP-binding protein [Bacillus pseudomycoides]
MIILNLSNLVKKDIYILVLMVFTVPLVGEIKSFPLNETFRMSFGAPTFFFFLLLFRRMPAFFPGFLTAIVVVAFRILLDVITKENMDWIASFHIQYPSFFFYFTYSCLFYLAKVERFHHQPLMIGFIGCVIEILSDCVELMIQYFVLKTTITPEALNEIIITAFSHSFIVLSFFNMMKLYEAQSRERQIKKQNEHMLMLISNLYEDAVHLKKTLQDAENITKKSYDLYKNLDSLENKRMGFRVEDLRQQALKIAGEVHDVKKDNQRIFAGLSKLISDESFTDYMSIHELVNIIIRANEKYARLLEKDIQFVYKIDGVHPHYHIYTILSIINNVVANAVEAIQDMGTITIDINKDQHFVEFRIGDNGPGISSKYKESIFEPGFTSKYDDAGNPSTGIGLSYVKEMVEQLEGDVTFEDRTEGKGSIFIIRLGIDHIIAKG